MCHLRRIFLIAFCCLCVLGCSSSVWESDACKNIEHHKTSVQTRLYPVDLPLFKPLNNNKVFSISESLTLPAGIAHNLSRLAMSDSKEMTIADEVFPPHEANAVALKSLEEKKLSGYKKGANGGMRQNKGLSTQCIDINTAEIAQLMTLPGIGQTRAESIVQARNKRPFRRKKDITRIKGISAKSYQKLQEYLCEI